MNIATQAEIVLRDAQYDTLKWTGIEPTVICFEGAALIGFVHIFESAETLLQDWEANQRTTLARHAAAFRSAGAKAWNVYSVFLTNDPAPSVVRAVERIEENFALTRKIARTSIQTSDDLERALLPLISIKAKPLLSAADFEARLRTRLRELPADAVTALLSETPGAEVARILGAAS